MGVVNVQQGRASGIYGLPEIQKRINEIMSACVQAEAETVIADAARGVYSELKSHAASVGMPQRAQQDIFLYTRQPNSAGKLNLVTALAGMRKFGRGRDAKGYVTWNASRQVGQFDKTSRSRRKRGSLRIPGTRVGENLGTMWEYGTTKMAPRPWARPAVQSARPTVLAKLVAGYTAILQRHGA